MKKEIIKGLAIAGIVAGGVGNSIMVGQILETQRLIEQVKKEDAEKLQSLRDELRSLMATTDEDAERNLIGDCLTENHVRIDEGFPIVTLEECRQERRDWKKEMDDLKNGIMPKPTPDPNTTTS